MMSLYSLVVSPLLLLAFGISEGFQTGIAILAGLALILLFVILRYFSGKFQGRIRQVTHYFWIVSTCILDYHMFLIDILL